MTENEITQLRNDIVGFMNSERAPEVLPLPAQADRATLSPAQQATLFENWVAYIHSRPQNTWTAAEINAYRVACLRAARGGQ